MKRDNPHIFSPLLSGVEAKCEEEEVQDTLSFSPSFVVKVPLGSFCRNSHLNFQTALTNKKFFSAQPHPLPANSQTRHTQCREKQLQPRPIMVLNYQANGTQRKTERQRETSTQMQRRRDSERRRHALLVQRESELTMDE